MKIFRFDPEVGRNIDQYNSSGFVLSKVAHLTEEAVVHCVYLDAHGVIGVHQATIPQLLLVVQGEGWVRGETPGQTAIPDRRLIGRKMNGTSPARREG